MDPLIETRFLPRPWLRVDERAVVKDGPIRIGGGMPSVCEFLWRTDDGRVYVRGAVRRPGREAIWLGHWHQVVMNADTKTLSSRVLRVLNDGCARVI